MQKRNDKCESGIEKEFESRIHDFRTLMDADSNGAEDAELGRLDDYGLCFDYVAPGTFDDQREGYFRYQISWRGPSDEFRFFVNSDLTCHRVECWFLDWFDGAHRVCRGESETVILPLWHRFVETGLARRALKEAQY
jgi:hypothetical protein